MATAIEMAAAESGGVISEDVIERLFNITPVERPFVDSIGDTTADHYKKEFTDKILQPPNANNTYYENQDLSNVVDNNYGKRYYNLCQQMVKSIKMSQRGRDVKTTYNTDEYLQQLMDAGEELRRDEEAAAVSRNAATAEVANTSGALMAGCATWAIHTFNGARGIGGANAVLDGSTNVGGGPTTAPTAGNKRVMTETMLRQALRFGWENGAYFDCLMSTGDMIETIAGYLFTSSARVASIETSAPQGNRTYAGSGNGAQQGGIVAQGSVNIFVGNFGTVILCPNRQQTTYTAADTGNVVDVLFFDSRFIQMAYLSNYSTKKISNTGLYDHEVLFVDATMIPGATHGITTVADIIPDQAMVP